MKKLNEILGTKYPFIQGGMANIATGEFAAACSNAGALGMIATGGWDGDRLRQEIRRAKEEKAQRNGAFRERVFLEKVLEEELPDADKPTAPSLHQ